MFLDKLTDREKDEFLTFIRPIIKNESVQLMDTYRHHHEMTCLEHSFFVAIGSYYYAKKMGLDIKKIVKGAILHDLFLYDWHYLEDRKRFHGIRHPKIALHNARRMVNLDKIEEDIIVKHMWPITVVPPKYMESWLVCATDKYCAVVESMVNQDKLRGKLRSIINEAHEA